MRLRLAEVGEENDNMMANVVDVEIVYIKQHIIQYINCYGSIDYNVLMHASKERWWVHSTQLGYKEMKEDRVP